MNDDEIFEGLTKLGLSPYEIKVYKSLLVSNPLTSSEVVKNSGIPQPRIYDILNSLSSKGLIEVSPGNPKIYHALPISETLKKQVDILGNFVERLNLQIQESRANMGVELPYLWLIEGEKKINERISRMVNHAKNEVILSLSSNRLKLFEQDIISAVSRGVTVAIVLFSDTPLEEISHLSKRIVVRKDDIRRPRIAEIIISDRSNSLIDMSTLRMGTSYALYYDENQLLHILSYYYYHLIWSPSKYIQSFTNTHIRTFSTIWLACDAIEAYMREGLALTGDVEGVCNDKPIRIIGNVTGTERIIGLRHSFYIETEGTKYSVGGKTATLEDIRMHKFTLTATEKKESEL